MTDFVLYGTPLSPFVRKVQAVLHHARAPYDFENVNVLSMPDWFLEISPARRVPVLRDKTIATEGVAGTIPDSSAISLFLDKRFSLGLYGNEDFETGRIAWLEEYADTVFAATIGMKLFRPITFPLYAGEQSDISTAKRTWDEKLPPMFDYLETALDGRIYFVGKHVSIADYAIATQMLQIDIVAGLPDPTKWPSLVKHAETMKTNPVFSDNLAACAKILRRRLPEKIDLN